MKKVKQKMLLLVMLTMAATVFSQIPTVITYNVGAGSCIYSDSSNNGYTFTNSMVVAPPSLGTITVNPVGGSFIYCAPGGMVGTDTAVIYGCVTNGIILFPVCDTFTVIFNIQSGNCTFTVSLVQDTAICIGGNRHYTAVATGGTASYTYLWSDGTTSSGACELNPGLGTCVTVTDANGCIGTACSNVNGCGITVALNDSTMCMGPLPGISGFIAGGTPPYSYVIWNALTNTILVSGTTVTGQIQDVCNLTPGTYCADVTDSLGCFATQCYTIQGAGGCYFTYVNGPFFGSITQFTSYNDSAYTAVSWLWSFGDGTGSSAQNPSHSYATGGYYLVSMNVYYSNGDSCFYSEYIWANDSMNTIACQAYFYSYIDSANSNTFHFVDYSAYNPSAWYWDFGDGNSSTLQNPSHTYNTTGNWNVCLTITSANGCTATYCSQLSNVPVQDLEAYLFHQTSISPGFPVWVYLDYYNAGTILVNGTVTYRYPAGTTVNATSLVPVAHDVANRLLTFNVGNIIPGTSGSIMIDLDASASLVIGSLAEDTMWVNPIAGDISPANNVSVVIDSVSGSWDPNDKAVSPKGEGAHGVVPVSTNELSYRIRFQNTGNAPAQTVQIRDAISNNIDLTTVTVTDASHAHTTEIIGSELVVTFANINLPDSGADYAASQGYVYVRAKLKPGLTTGTQIFNTAEIYFDFNAPVVTNTVETTLGGFVSGINAITNFEFAMFPNPANNSFSLNGEFERGAVYELMNQLGQTVLNGEINSNTTAINLENLSNGVYLVKITSGGKFGVQRLVVAR